MIRPVRRLLLIVLLATIAAVTSFHTELNASASPSGEDPHRYEVILSQEHLDAVWPELLGPNPPLRPAPSLDFDPERVIVYSVGPQPNECYSAEINAVRAEGDAVLVEVIEKEPAPNCVCTFSLVEFFHVIRLDSKEGRPSLCVRRPQLNC